MPVNIQILWSALDSLVLNQAQFTLNSRCLPELPPDPPLPASFFDFVNVLDLTRTVQPGVVTFSIRANVAIVTRDDLEATFDTGADPRRRVIEATIMLTLSVLEGTLWLICDRIVPADPRFQEKADEISRSLGVVGSFGLGVLFHTLGTPPASSTAFEATEASLFIQFDPTGDPPEDHLFLGMEWCCFIDAAGMEVLAADFVTRTVTPSFKKKGISPNPAHATWAPKGPGPSGLIPHVRAGITGRGHKDCLWYTAEALFDIDFYVQNLILLGPSMVQYIAWNLDIWVDETLGILFWAQSQANDEAAQAMRDFDPTTVEGGKRMGAPGTMFGDHNFEVDSRLPRLAFESASLGFNRCMAFPEGMAIGGAVNQGNPPSPLTTNFTTTIFPDMFTAYLSCRSGTRTSTSVTAVSTSSNVGRICAVDIVSPSPDSVDISPYLSVSPAPETTTDSVSIGFTLPPVVAFQVHTTEQPVVVQVRTTRGVRMVNFGRPPLPDFDEKGQVKNAEEVLLDDCGKFTKVLSTVIRKIPYAILSKIWLVDPPPIWVDRVEEVATFESSLVAVRVRPGESVIFNQPKDGGMSIISAVGNAEIVNLPMLLAVRSFDEGASLETMGRSDIASVTSTSKLFQRVATLDKKGAISHELVGGSTSAQVITTFDNRVETTEIDNLGLCQVVNVSYRKNSNWKEGAMEVSPAKTEIPGIHGCIAIHPVPGLEDHPTSIAEFEDGSYRVLSPNDHGELVVTGMVPRWLKMPRVSGGWAISSTTKDRIAVFSVTQTDPKTCSCKCQCGAMAPQIRK